MDFIFDPDALIFDLDEVQQYLQERKSMDPFDITNAAIDSAQCYYDHLKSKKGGRVVIHSRSIIEIGKNLFEIQLSQKLRSTESLELCVCSPLIDQKYYDDKNERFISNKYVKICKYNKDIPSLCIDVHNDLIEVFRTLKTEDVYFVTDLTFLVKNVKKWYNKHGNSIKYPPDPPSFEQIYFQGSESPDQLNAVKTALENPVSYIWGPPGTGKTQVVLTDCIITHIDNNLPTIIVAPTNNAIEQVLRSVIDSLVAQDRNEDIDCLYRMGLSSDSFVRDFGRICERFDKQSQIDSIKQTISYLEDKLVIIEKAKNTIKAYEQFLVCRSKLEQLNESKISLEENLSVERSNLQQIYENEDTSKKYFSILVNELHQIIIKEKSIKFRLKRMFSKEEKLTFLAKKEELQSKINKENSKKERLSKLKLAQEKTLVSLEASLNENSTQINNCQTKIKDLSMMIGVTADDINTLSTLFQEKMQEASKVELDDSIEEEIKTQQEILKKITEDQEAALTGKLVFAFTIDYLISHFDTIPIKNLAHVFMDEAAYCPFIKAGALFALDSPITMFGDHMQLPPVCEIDEKIIKAQQSNVFLWSHSAIHFPQIFEDGCSIDKLYQSYANNLSPDFKSMKMSPLTHTFRFGDNLAGILNEFVYKNDFSGSEEFNTQITVISAHRGNELNLRENHAEAYAIYDFIRRERPTDYAVMTPYNSQVDLLKQILRSTSKDNILTVHKSQGREWDTVILSVVDTKQKFFTDSTSKVSNGLQIINTAISRAKKEIVIVCDADYWEDLSSTQLIGRLVSSK